MQSPEPVASGAKHGTAETRSENDRSLRQQMALASARHNELIGIQRGFEQQLGEHERTIARLKARRVIDLDRLTEISRARDLLERRASAQMAKVNLAMTRLTGHEQSLQATASQGGPSGAAGLSQDELAQIDGTAHHLPASLRLNAATERPQPSGWFARRAEQKWWIETALQAALAHRGGRLLEAQLLCEAALIVRQTASLWTQLGHSLREQMNFEAAEIAYQRALDIEPTNGENEFLAGYCAEKVGNKAKAAVHYTAALALEPKLADRYDHLVEYHARLEG